MPENILAPCRPPASGGCPLGECPQGSALPDLLVLTLADVLLRGIDSSVDLFVVLMVSVVLIPRPVPRTPSTSRCLQHGQAAFQPELRHPLEALTDYRTAASAV